MGGVLGGGVGGGVWCAISVAEGEEGGERGEGCVWEADIILFRLNLYNIVQNINFGQFPPLPVIPVKGSLYQYSNVTGTVHTYVHISYILSSHNAGTEPEIKPL
jgi:hypothetical protein